MTAKEDRNFIILLIKIMMYVWCIILVALSKTNYNHYDVNGDGKITAQDYVAVKNYIMEQED